MQTAKSCDDVGGNKHGRDCLKCAGINTVGDLVSKSKDGMREIHNLGRRSLEEITAKLDSLGFKLNMDN